MGRMQTSGGYCLLCFGGRTGNVLIISFFFFFFFQTGSVCSKWYDEHSEKKRERKPLFYWINPSFPSLHSHCWRLQGQQPIDWTEARSDGGWKTVLLFGQRKSKRCKIKEERRRWNLRVLLFRFQHIVGFFLSSIRISGNSFELLQLFLLYKNPLCCIALCCFVMGTRSEVSCVLFNSNE